MFRVSFSFKPLNQRNYDTPEIDAKRSTADNRMRQNKKAVVYDWSYSIGSCYCLQFFLRYSLFRDFHSKPPRKKNWEVTKFHCSLSWSLKPNWGWAKKKQSINLLSSEKKAHFRFQMDGNRNKSSSEWITLEKNFDIKSMLHRDSSPLCARKKTKQREKIYWLAGLGTMPLRETNTKDIAKETSNMSFDTYLRGSQLLIIPSNQLLASSLICECRWMFLWPTVPIFFRSFRADEMRMYTTNRRFSLCLVRAIFVIVVMAFLPLESRPELRASSQISQRRRDAISSHVFI